jgi:hypothetical protein
MVSPSFLRGGEKGGANHRICAFHCVYPLWPWTQTGGMPDEKRPGQVAPAVLTTAREREKEIHIKASTPWQATCAKNSVEGSVSCAFRRIFCLGGVI